MWFSGARVREKDPPCVRSSRAARVRMPRKTRTVPCTREGGVVRCLGAGMRRLGWQRYRLAAPPPAGVQDAARGCTEFRIRRGLGGERAERGQRRERAAREAYSEGPEVCGHGGLGSRTRGGFHL